MPVLPVAHDIAGAMIEGVLDGNLYVAGFQWISA